MNKADSIKAESLDLRKILVDEDKFYQVPIYQRPYSWDKDNISDLINDLIISYSDNKNEPYFCGSLVLVNNKTDERFDIIDGQQRITTFIILACVIKNIYFDKLKDNTKEYIEKSIVYKCEDKDKLKFLTDETQQSSFKNTFILNKLEFNNIKNSDRKIKDNRYLQNAYYIKQELEEHINTLDIHDFVVWLYKSVILTVITCPNQDSAIRIFNVLNDRGMPLSSTDILKSSLMQKLKLDEDKKAFKAKWVEIEQSLKYENILLEDMLNSYLYFKIAKNPKFSFDKELSTVFKLNSKEAENPIKIIEEIGKYSKYYIEIFTSQNRYINCLKHLPNRIYWISILSSAKFENYKDYDELLKLLVAYYYQNLIAGATASRFKQTSFKTIDLVKTNKNIKQIKQELNSNLSSYRTIEQYKDNLTYSDVFWSKWVKPTLLLIEYFLTDDENPKFIEINNKLQLEHILPQNPSGYWSEKIKEDERETWTHALANLTLLSMKKNIQASNSDFETKKKIYGNKDNAITSFLITQEILKEDDWNVEVLEKREEELISRINKVIDLFG